MTSFHARGDEVRLGEVVVRSHGITGDAEVLVPGVRGLRGSAAEGTLDAELAETGMVEQVAVELTDLTVEAVAAAPPRHRSAAAEEAGSPHVELEVPAPVEGWDQVVLAEDDDGVLTWHFGSDEGGLVSTRGGVTRTYRVGVRGHPPSQSTGRRGLLGGVVRKVVKVLAFRVAADVGGDLVSWWESRKRPHRLIDVGFAPRVQDAADVAAGRWASLAGGPLLLLVHGTNSRCATGFGSLPAEEWTRFASRYGKRVVGFDHPTLSVGPDENVEWLVQAL
ncbi:MAG: hypothetical protein M3217_04205, partial [Actinomycetota bacterium]|nr:hypothetical protein [Actinomycetota bacterium]